MEPKPTTTSAGDSKLHFLDYWRIIRIRKNVILAVFLLVVVTTTVVTYLVPESFSSTVRIKVEKDATDVSSLFERQTATPYDPYFMQTEFEVIQSKHVLYSVITNLNLNERWAKERQIEGKLQTPETYLLLRKQIDVRQTRNTSLIEIRVFSENKEEAAVIANKIAEVYKKTRLDIRSDASKRGIESYQKKLDEQELKVQGMQKEVDRLRIELEISEYSAESAMPSPTLDAETVRKLDSERISAESDYSRLNTMLVELKKMKANNPLELRKAIPVTYQADIEFTELLNRVNMAEQELATLLKDRTENHPDVQRVTSLLKTVNQQIENKIDGILSGLEVKVASLKSQAAWATKDLTNARKQDVDNAKKNRPYYVKKRDLENEQRIRDALMMKIMTETVEKELPRGSIVEVTDTAEPGLRPVRPNIPLNIVLGVMVGLVVGLGLAFFIEYLDTSVKTIDDVEHALNAAVLGVIPQNVGLLMDEGPESPHAEAYRVLRTNLLFSRKNPQLNTLTVISGGAAEGKSTTIFNLATIFAQAGQRILVVDSDLRRPSLHKFLKITNSIGLTNYLLKQNTLEEVIQTSKIPSLDFLPSGKLPSSAMGILNSVRMKEFINEVSRRYDFVFFDSPPIMGVSDASVLASLVSMVLLVVQYRKYPQAMTVRAKQMVEKVGGNLLGVVLNNINISQDSYYYYYSGYYYDYYSKHDDDKSAGKSASDDGKSAKDQSKLEIKQKY